ncbi:hypothetical protein CJ179_36700 [Rhodococcus sp. ACS1]|nr:hypothetical protein CJ179_36700 [Rhodococcus sp. ACS1]
MTISRTTALLAGPDVVGPDLIVEERDAVVTSTFNRPDKLNALTPQMYQDLGRSAPRVASLPHDSFVPHGCRRTFVPRRHPWKSL